MPSHAAELAHSLARNAEAVCRHYLSNGHREGRYWLVGDARKFRTGFNTRAWIDRDRLHHAR